MRLLTAFLGTGNYEFGRYVWTADRSTLPDSAAATHETRFVQAALARILQPDRCIVFATQDAEKKHWTGLLDAFAEIGLPEPEKISIEEGKDTEELRANFHTIISTLNREALFPRREQPDADDRVFIDITHGFRSLPFFAGAAISLLKAVRADWPMTQVIYGAWDARARHGEGRLPESPIWDLTYFVDMVDWAQALRLFLKTGRAEDAARIGEQVGNRLGAEWDLKGRQGARPQLKDFGRALREFSSHFSTVRTGRLLLGDGHTPSLADRLLEHAESIRQYAGAHLPGLNFMLEELIGMIKPLKGSPEHLAGPAHAGRVAALSELYQRFDRPLQAAMTLREGYINLVATPNAARPGTCSFDRRARKRAEDIAHSLYPCFRHEVSDLRNDLMHAGYRQNAVNPKGLAQSLDKVVDGFRKDGTISGVFLNISNHPSSEWDVDQRRAARALGQPIRDLPFPEVPPEADEAWIRCKADELAESVCRLAPAAALVQGEFTLSFALVERLEATGIACYAASSPRLVEEGGEKGSETPTRVTRRTFRFTRLRRYVRQG